MMVISVEVIDFIRVLLIIATKKGQLIKFNNTYSKLPSHFFDFSRPAEFKSPELIMFNKELALELNIDTSDLSDKELALIFSGQKILDGSEPLSQVYAAYQFGHKVPILGDGRAHLLGETKGFDIQLKGSGQSKYSRRGDGRSSLGPVVREYIVSEAMHYLGVPTTRALAAVSTGEKVARQEFEPGGVFTRVASSHIRVGTFQYFAFKGDWEGIKTLLDYTIKRHYPELASIENIKDRSIAFVNAVGERQAKLVAHWMSLGFIHGVMNTDNFSVAGISIDFGPCAFIDEFDHKKVFSSIDQMGRYSYQNQVSVAQWNMLRLAECFLFFIDEDVSKAASIIEKEIDVMMNNFNDCYSSKMAAKFGIHKYQKSDDKIIGTFLNYLEKESLDFTLSFRYLKDLFSGGHSYFPDTEDFKQFLQMWKERVDSVDGLDLINPLYIPRNHQVEKAIRASFQGDLKVFEELVEVCKNPFHKNEKLDFYKTPPEPSERVLATFCGT
jgi:uncharacterized protein YdiU (UPF0061 family)